MTSDRMAPDELTREQQDALSATGVRVDEKTLVALLAEIKRLEEEEKLRGWR